ncbi:MAG: PBP1A family penicillin-binding protein [Elusimicrobia bacterium]|nr:PBP1A family penicillin-binding protein [Elusimicrobiota bacterium]
MPRRRFYLYAALAAVCILAVGLTLRSLLAGLPATHSLDEYTPALTTRIFDWRDELVAELSIEKRALLPLSKIPVDLQNAVLAIEDDAFFKHWGVSPRGIFRSAVANFFAGRFVQGGSTITQQLSKQIFLTRERTIARKIREILLAVQIEREFSKQEILQLYLNQVYFGEGAYGVQAAARIYFGKEVGGLNLAECALLAGLIRAPRGYCPFNHPDRARRRRAVVLDRMQSEGFINDGEKTEALKPEVPLSRPLDMTTQAPYFVEHVRSRLERKYGTNAVWRGGLKVYTTLDLKMQKIAEEVMEKGLSDFDEKAAKDWEAKLKEDAAAAEADGEEGVEVSTTLPKIQGAFIAIDVKTGAVRAMIGGRDSKFNRAVQAYRQPGSTFKPFVWAAALNAGMTGASLVEDNPLAFYFDGRDWRLLEGATDQYSIDLATAPFAESPDFKIWVPNDFDGKFLGVITLRKALALSRNIASINLINQIGPPLVVDIAHRAGIRSELEPVPALGLGASVVSPLEMTSAFGTFANGGIYVLPYTAVRVEDSQGKELERYVPTEREATTPQLAYLMTDLLKTVVTGGTGRYARFLAAKHPMAGKTGTSNDNRDLWFIGYTPELVAGAWMGYDDFGSLGKKDWTGGSTVVPWWTAIMERVLQESPKKDFPIPPGIVFQSVCADTGLLALPSCPRKVSQSFMENSQPTEYCAADHSRPLELAPGAASGAVQLPRPTTGQALEGEEGLYPLPSEEEILGQPETEDPNFIE